MYRDLLAEQRNLIVGIDLGTTNSLIAVAIDCSTRIISSPDGERMLPSVAALDETGELVVGKRARGIQLSSPNRAVSSIKRFMGMSAEESQKHGSEVGFEIGAGQGAAATFRIGDREMSAPELSALYLKELKRWAETDLGRPVERAVITVPAYFSDAQRQATRDAAKIAGLEVLRIVNEPTAAALAYGLQERQEGRVAVYDFGGGTFDVSILHLDDGVFEVLATGGDTRLGGDDIDWAVAEWLLLATGAKKGLREQSPGDRTGLLRAAESAKIALVVGGGGQVRVPVTVERVTREVVMRLEDFDAAAAPVVERTLTICREVVKASGLSTEQLDEAILVGGSSRLPIVQRMVGELFGRAPKCEINPDEVVALGAAVQGRILAGGMRDMLLLDVTPLSLGIETWGGAFDIVIPRNTTIPASASASFSTNVDGQKNILIHVLQGERELANDNQSLARFVLGDLPPMPAGEARVEVTFTLNADGMLGVSAKEQRTGREASVEVRPSSGLTESDVRRIIEESYAHAQEDFARRVLLDRRNEAQAVVRAVDLALKQTGAELERAYRAEVVSARDALAAAIAGEDGDAIRTALEQCNAVTDRLAEIQMNQVLAVTVAGRPLDDI